jgi:integrase
MYRACRKSPSAAKRKRRQNESQRTCEARGGPGGRARRQKKKARFYNLGSVARIIAASQGEQRVFYWLAAETGLRAGEIAGLGTTHVEGERLTVNQSVWHGKVQSPKTENAARTLAVSP